MSNSSRSARSAEARLSDNSGFVSADGDFIYSIEAHIASKDPFRVVGYGIPRPYPLRNGGCSPEMAAIVQNSMGAAAAEILQDYGIRAECMLRTRWRPREPVQHTYLIGTSDADPSRWLHAAIEINQLFLEANVAQEAIEVEITNKYLCNATTSTALPNDPILLNALEGTRFTIVNFLQAHAPSYWTSVAFHVRHNKLRPQDAKPTILVFFHIGACSNFETMERDLKEELKLKVPIIVEFLCGEIDLDTANSGPIIPLFPIGLLPRNGDSLGVHSNATDAGTLGGWLNLRYPSDPNKPHQVGMTVFHLANTDKTSEDLKLHPKAVNDTASSNKIQMESPAAFDRNHAISYYERLLQQGGRSQAKLNSAQKELELLKQLNADPIIGTVLYHSGVRANANNHRMDWVLFEINKTWQPNIPPPASSFLSGQSRSPTGARGPVFYAADANSRLQGFGKMEPGSWVAKRGRTSVDTSGEVNRLRRSVNWTACSRFVTEEIEVLGLNTKFADGGDSGAWVINENHELVGMVIGRDNESDVGLVSEIGEIQADFEALTNGGKFELPG